MVNHYHARIVRVKCDLLNGGQQVYQSTGQQRWVIFSFSKGILCVCPVLIKPFRSLVYRPSPHTLYALAHLHSSKRIRLVSLHGGWQSYSLSSALT